MTRPFAIIGDIHGEAGRLSALLNKVEGRRLIFVGDYINRGSNTRQTLNELIALKKRDPETVCLLGNHETALMDFLAGDLPFYQFAGLGGLATIRSYLSHAKDDVRAELLRAMPDTHRGFVEDCDVCFETPDLIVSHCGINPDNPGSRGRADMVMSRHEGLFSPDFKPSKLVVFGHYVQTAGVPYTRDGCICLDTGCGTSGGPLTALLMPERKILQL